MERLQPRNNMQNTTMTLAKKLLRIAFWCGFVVMSLVGLWFTVVWSMPQETAVEHSLQGAYYEQGQQQEIRIQGTYAHYMLANQPDSFRGYLTVGDTQYYVELQIEMGQTFGCTRKEGNDGYALLLSRDQKTLFFQDAADRILIAPGDQTTADGFWKLLNENPEWAEAFDLD